MLASLLRDLRQQVYNELGRVLVIVRVVYQNRCLPVTRQSSDFVASLDKAWCRPPSVFVAPYCQLCLKNRKLNGASVTPNNDGSCPLHSSSEWAHIQFTHESLKLNCISSCWCKYGAPGAVDALQSTKMACVGLAYFARSMRKVLPKEILEKIISAAAYKPELDSANFW